LLAKPVDYLQAAHTVVAKDNQRSFLRLERVQNLSNTAHRDQFAPFNAGLSMFKRFADIDEAQFFAGVKTLFYFTWSNLERHG